MPKGLSSREPCVLLERTKIQPASAALLIVAGTLLAATVPYLYDCDVNTGFIADSSLHKRVGYVTSLQVFGGPALNSDLTISVPFLLTHELLSMVQPMGLPPVTNVVGVMHTFSWNGGTNDPLNLNFYVSQENATMLKALQPYSLNNHVSSLGWWIGDYDLTVV